MSLLTSKGDPDRPCVACDTRFEITDARLATLKADGYEIVGRYLTEPGQSSLAPKDYFKAIRPGELERITRGACGSSRSSRSTPRSWSISPRKRRCSCQDRS